MSEIRCVECGQCYPDFGVPFRCPKCGGLFDFDGPPDLNPAKMEPELPGYWRFRHSFSLFEKAPIVSLGEGNTPFLWQEISDRKVGLKLESLNPTGSYKDRGSAVLLSQLLGRGIHEAVEDSSGNAGASFAAYAAQANIKGRVFVPESASGPKRYQIEMYGTDLVRVPGPRSEAARAVLTLAEKGIPYASHAFLPFGLPGIATIAYEIWEQMGGQIPETLIAPVGHGGLLLGIFRGFAALKNAGLIERIPYYVGVQAAACDPVVRAFQYGIEAAATVGELPTLAEGVRVREPVRMKALIDEIRPEKGTFVSISEEDIRSGYTQLARRGIYVEPTSSLAWAAWTILAGKIPEPAAMILSGFGLKYIPSN